MANKVKKGEAFIHYGYKKFDWICAECGLAWRLRRVAQACASRGHTSQYYNHYGDVYKARRQVHLEES